MLTPWPVLRAQLVRSTQTLAFQRQFRALFTTEPVLAGYVDPPALLDALHGPADDTETRNQVLTALVRRSKAEPEPATTLLLLALWPGLDAIYRRLSRHFRGQLDHLASEILARTVAGIRGLDLDRVHRIAATLIRNCERDIVRGLKRGAADRKFHIHRAEGEGSPTSSPGACWEEDVLRLVERLRPVIGADAPLVVAIAVVGERQQDAAAAIGLRHDAGRKRYQRALERVRLVAEEFS